MQGPDRYLVAMGVSLPCAVHPDQTAIIDSAHRAFVNHEVYYFGSDAALQAFVAEPWRYTGDVTDPVSRVRFQPSAANPRRSHGGRLFFLMNPENAAAFDREPTTYGVPRPAMRSMRAKS